MKNQITLSLIFIAFSLNTAFTQKIAKKEVRGDKHYAYYSFNKAIEDYSKVDSLSVSGRRKLAEAYKNTGKYAQSEQEYSKYINFDGVDAEDYYNYASILEINGKYAESDKWMNKFISLKPNDLRAKQHAKHQNNIEKLLKDEGRYTTSNLKINSTEQDFGATYYEDKIVYASSKEGVKSIKRSYNWNGKPFLDLYVAEIDEDGEKFSKPKALHPSLNRKMHEGPASFALDGSVMAFTRNNYEGKSQDGVVKLQIYFCEKVAGKWGKEKPFKLNSPEYSVGHPWLSENGDTMYFASDKPGGFGAADIYKIVKNSSGEWGDATNLGEGINTEGDEMFPFFESKNGILFFSSNGHHGLGGLDVYLARYMGDSLAKLLNMGTPLNTSFDDFSLVVDAEMKNGYFSSNRTGGKGDDDIYSYEILKPFIFEKKLKGKSSDKSGNPLPGALVSLFDNNGMLIRVDTADENGNYNFIVEPDQEYSLTSTKDDYIDGNNKVNTFGEELEYTADLALDQKKPEFKLYYQIIDKNTKTPIPGVKLVITDKVTGIKDSILTNDSGDFLKDLPANKLYDQISYSVEIVKDGYLSKNISYKKVLNKEGTYNLQEEMDIAVAKITVGMDLSKLVDLKPIYFDLGKYNIRKDASVELDKIVKIMNEYPTMVVELGSHTDCRGDMKSNSLLSDYRAKSSADYIRKKITSPERIYGKGYGETKLINQCECEGNKNVTCSEAKHQENRRTEFIIIKM